MFLRRIAMTFIVSAIAAAPLMFGQTTTTTTRNSEVGPVGLGSTETIQVAVVNLASNSTSGTSASCTGSISSLQILPNSNAQFRPLVQQAFTTAIPDTLTPVLPAEIGTVSSATW